ncbi:putative F-box/LRR-repeat protein 23 [Silene latifolia]|uniref:putative F-box/LRR-repeat protein 23 n=1 Tax=Silene latifolia TaxID=37657 RepID=UPI003D778A12
MWRTIHVDNLDKPWLDDKYEKMTCNAVDRSVGGLIDLDIEGFGSDKLRSYVASRSSQLKRLRLAICTNISVKALKGALKKLSCLEELELTICKFRGKNTVPLINSCPSVTTFKLNRIYQKSKCDKEALAIARSMPELRHLQLIGNNMTYDGLTAILDGCRHLQSLDLRWCYNLDNAQKLDKRLSANIKDLRRPFDSNEEFRLQTLVNATKSYAC